MPDGLAAAAALGIRIEPDFAFAFQGIRFCEEKVSVEARFPAGHGLGMRRTLLHQAMVERAQEVGVDLAWGTHVTGIDAQGAFVDGRRVHADWIIGADGGQSRVRRWAGLDRARCYSARFGFRRHFRIAPWSEYMEIHWGASCQLYVTPVAREELCVVVISRDPHLRLEQALQQFSAVSQRLSRAEPGGVERGGASVTRSLRSVYRDRVALIGDASGSVDAITGEGLCLLFQQAVALADALENGNLAQYQQAHRRTGRRPAFMADLMLLLDGRARLRGRVLRGLAAKPALFGRMLATHVGGFSPLEFAVTGLSLGWQVLTA